MSDLSAFAGLAQAAYVETMAAAFIIPAAWPIVAIMYEGQSDPGAIIDAANGWKTGIDELQKAKDKIAELPGRATTAPSSSTRPTTTSTSSTSR